MSYTTYSNEKIQKNKDITKPQPRADGRGIKRRISKSPHCSRIVSHFNH